MSRRSCDITIAPGNSIFPPFKFCVGLDIRNGYKSLLALAMVNSERSELAFRSRTRMFALRTGLRSRRLQCRRLQSRKLWNRRFLSGGFLSSRAMASRLLSSGPSDIRSFYAGSMLFIFLFSVDLFRDT